MTPCFPASCVKSMKNNMKVLQPIQDSLRSTQTDSDVEAFHDKRNTYNCLINSYIANKSHTYIIGMCAHTKSSVAFRRKYV